MKLIPRRHDVFDDFFDNMFNEPFFKSTRHLMRTDVYEKGDNYVLKVDLPGYKKEEINVDYSDGYLNVVATHDAAEDAKDGDGNLIRSERAFGACARSFYIGEGPKKEDVAATYEHGVLTITVPKAELKLDNTNNCIEVK